MTLTPTDQAHALQIQAGVVGRKAGHAFEDRICTEINSFCYPYVANNFPIKHLAKGDPAVLLLGYIARFFKEEGFASVNAISTGALATVEGGRQWLQINGSDVRRCKSDIVLIINFISGNSLTVGISTKQCNNRKPTNAQLYFTTARGFSNLLGNNEIPVSDGAVIALRQFCGDAGFRPLDDPKCLINRASDPRRFFWEELSLPFRSEWESIFQNRQDDVTRLLLQKAYLNDPFVPDFVLHKTKLAAAWSDTEVAIFSIDELIQLSKLYQGFATKSYNVRKGSYRDPIGVSHQAPRFGIVQMQRGGQTQHPEQLQFNLEAGYFYRLENIA